MPATNLYFCLLGKNCSSPFQMARHVQIEPCAPIMRHWGLSLTVIEGSLKLVPISYHGACPQLELNNLCVLMETLACLVHTMENDLALLPVAQAQRPVAWTGDSYARVTQHLCSKAAAQFLYFLKWFPNPSWWSCLPVRYHLALLSG